MGLVLRNVQVDVPAAAFDAAVAYWAAALGGRDAGTGDPTYVHLEDLRSPVGVHLQRLGDGAARLHLDLRADDPDAEVARLLALGATRSGPGECTVLRDPAGLVLCVCGAEDVDAPGAATDGPEVRLHLVVLDVPARVLGPTVAFWADVFGATPEPVGAPFEAFTWLGAVPTPHGRVGVLVQALGDDDPARIHLDLHVPTAVDRDREVARLTALGAEPVAIHRHWQVLRAPGGHLHCVVPDEH